MDFVIKVLAALPFIIGISIMLFYASKLTLSHWSDKLSPDEKIQYQKWREENGR